MDYLAVDKFLVFTVFYLCFLICVKHTDSKDTNTFACYSSVPECGQHTMKCPEGETVIVTNARYAHMPRQSSCSRGKVSSCSPLYSKSCCRTTGNECYNPYDDEDAKRLLRPCLGSRTCEHMTPQTNQKCGVNKLTRSAYSVVTHRCVLNEHIIGYNIERQVINNLVYLLYRIPTERTKPGTAKVYGCDVSGPAGAKVKVRALDVGFDSTQEGTCSGLEVDKDGVISSYSCDRTDLRFLLNLYDGSLPVAVNIVDVSGRSPKKAWVLVEGTTNITVECGKIREIRKVEDPTTATSDVSNTTPSASVVTPSTSTSERTTTSGKVTTTIKSTTTITSTMSSSIKPQQDINIEKASTQEYGSSGKTKPEPPPEGMSTSVGSNTVQTVSSSGDNSNDDSTPLEPSVAVVRSSDHDRVSTYGGIAGGLLLLIVLIIIITIICYRRKRYRRYQSRKIEEERNIPDGEERSGEKVDEEKGKDTTDTNDGDQKVDNYDSPLPDSKNDNSSNGNKRVKGRKNRGQPILSGGTSPPRVSQPRDSDGYTNAGQPYESEDASRNVTVEFYDNPGFKTTLEKVKFTE